MAITMPICSPSASPTTSDARRAMPAILFLAAALLMALAAPSLSSAQSMADYVAAPPFLSTGLSSTETEADCQVRKPFAAEPASKLGNVDAVLRKLEPRESTN